jgi:hypothetical protein
MDEHRVFSKDQLANGPLRYVAALGLVSGMAAGSLGGAGTANASCLSIGGFFSIGSGCTSSPLSFALVLGNGTANAQGLLNGAIAIGNAAFADARGFLTGAIANGLGNSTSGPLPPETVARSVGALSFAYGGGTDTFVDTQGSLNIAAAQGNGYFVRAGGTPGDIGNVALSLGNNNDPDEPGLLAAVVAGDIGPSGRNPSYFNLALNLGDKNNVQAKGFANSVLNFFGNENAIAATGILNNATNIFGDQNAVGADNVPDGNANILGQIGGNVAFNAFGDRNSVLAGSQTAPPDGPLAIAGALGVDDQSVDQPGTGITIRTPFNATGSDTNVLAVGTTQGSAARPGLTLTSGRNVASNLRSTSPDAPALTSVNQRTGPAKKFSDQLKSSTKKIRDQLRSSTKKIRDNATRGGGKAEAANNS